MDVLISEIQKREVLWNKRHPRYKDRYVVEKEWNLVAKNTGFTSDEARKKWRNLRDQFSKELKRIPKTKSGDSQDSVPKYPGKWQYFNMLLFLRDILTPRATEGNISEVDTQSLEPNHKDSDEEELSNPPVTDVDDETGNTDTRNVQLLSTSQVIPQVAETFSEQSISATPSKRHTTTLMVCNTLMVCVLHLVRGEM